MVLMKIFSESTPDQVDLCIQNFIKGHDWTGNVIMC